MEDDLRKDINNLLVTLRSCEVVRIGAPSTWAPFWNEYEQGLTQLVGWGLDQSAGWNNDTNVS